MSRTRLTAASRTNVAPAVTIPDIPADLIAATSQVYIDAYQAITGQTFVPDMNGDTMLDRVRSNLAPYFTS